MTKFISHVHSEIRRARLTRRGATDVPENVPRGLHKSYPRMEGISLPEPIPPTKDFAEILSERTSYMGGSVDRLLTLQEWGTLLGLALRKHPDSMRRRYPSGGALYPIETYVLGRALEGLPPSAFHYNPSLHTLERLWDMPEGVDVKEFARKPDDLLFSSLVVFTSVWKRSSAKYGDFTYSLALLEAGHMSENILLTATALGLHARPMAGFNDERVSDLLDLVAENEQPVHSITLSK